MANGDIGAAVDTFEFELTNIERPDIVHVSGDVFAIAFEDASGDGVVVTVDIDAAGEIGAAVIDTLKFDAVDGHEIKIIHVLGDIFAIAYRGVDSDGFLVTVEISTAGAMGAAVEDTLEFDTVGCWEPDPIMITDSIIAIVYRDSANQGKIITAAIDAAGQIGAATIDDKNAWAANCNNPSIVHVSGDIFAIAYMDNVYDGHVCTMDIDTAGAIGASVVDTLEFDTSQGADPRICKVLGNIFAIAYRGPGDDGYLCTVDISDAGAIGAAVEDTLEFDTAHCTWPDIAHLGNGIVAIAYGGNLYHGFLVTVQTGAAGQIGAAVIDSEEYDTSHGTYPSIIHVSGDQYAIAYIGADSDGFIKTPTIVTPTEGRIQYLPLMGIG